MRFNLSGFIGIVGVAALPLLPARAATTAVLSYTPGEFQGFGAPTVNGGAMNEVTGPFTFSNVDALGLNVTVSASAPAITEFTGNTDFPVAGLLMGDGATSVFTWQLNAGFTLNWIEFDFLYLSHQMLNEFSDEERLSNFYGTGANIASASLLNASNVTWDGTTIDPTSDGAGTFRVEFDGEVSQFGWQYDLVRGSPQGAAISELRLGLVQVQGGNTPPSVTITNPVNDAVFIAPATFTVDASASDPDGSVSQVQFLLDATSLGTDTVSPYSANVNNLAAGTYTLSAVAMDNQSARATNSITVIVNAQPIDPTFSDANWSPLGSGLGPGSVYALAVSGNDLYAGGWFRTAGGSPATNIAKWDGTSWSALGSGMNVFVGALAVSGSDLYAGGEFRTAGGSPANRIAKWDGSSWRSDWPGCRLPS